MQKVISNKSAQYDILCYDDTTFNYIMSYHDSMLFRLTI